MISRRLAASVVVLVALVGGIAYAAIPDATGTYHACLLKGTGTIRIIDPDAQRCNAANETEITFGARGPQGLPGLPGTNGSPGAAGANGISPTVAQIGPGTNCATGGVAITGAGGTTAYACNGANGAAGQDGAAFSGTFTSPNGQYSIQVADTGIQLRASDGTHLLIQAGTWDARSTGDLSLTGDQSAQLRSGANLDVRAGANATIQAGSVATLKGAALLDLGGPLVRINSPTSCLSAARASDQVSVPFTGTATIGTIFTGSTSVCIG